MLNDWDLYALSNVNAINNKMQKGATAKSHKNQTKKGSINVCESLGK